MALNIVLIALFGTFSPVFAFFQLLTYIGMCGIFEKCGEKGWKALIPCYRELILGRTTNRVIEGRILFGVNLILKVCEIFVQTKTGNYTMNIFFEFMYLMLAFIGMIYNIRIFGGLQQLFDRKKKWILLWIVASPIPALLWGFGSKYEPKWTVQDLDTEISEYFSNAHMEVMAEGLTVNLEERSARELGRKKVLLRDVHMNIAPGRMVLLLGGSGAGKTTLLNAINGYEKAKAEVHLNGSNVYKQYKAMQYEIGFVPQLDLMRGKDSVGATLYDAANLRLPQDVSRADRHKRVEEVMEIFGLKAYNNTMVEKLSGGQRKRLSIAMEFISNPSLFILDEPDSGLDGVMARELMQQLRKIADQGKIVIVITHTPDRVIDLFDDVIVLAKDSSKSGRLAFYGPIEQAKAFFERERMEQIVMCINRKEEGGEGRADEFVRKFGEVQHV